MNYQFPKDTKRIYLIGVCGTGMGALAGLLKEKGYIVSGSDNNVYPPMSTELERQDIPIYSPYGAKNIKEARPDLVVVGNAISRDHVEARTLLESGIPYVSMPQALNHFFLKDREVIVCAGTHGKTTVTALMSYLLDALGADPSFFAGGVTKNYSKNFRLGNGRYFVIEGDEYDTAFFDKGPKFVHYNPKHVILTSLEFDHADIFKGLNELTAAFAKLCDIIPDDGSLHYCDAYPGLHQIVARGRFFKRQYGVNSPDFKISGFTASSRGSEFLLASGERPLVSVTSPLSGLYNAQNVAACFSVLAHLGFDLKKAASALKDFAGIKRRQEMLYKNKNFVVIDDFAHHPTAVRQTIAGMRGRFPDHHLLAVFEPRSNTSRRDIFQKEYVQSLLTADEVIVAPVNQPEKVKDGHILNVAKIVREVTAHGKPAHNPPTTAAIIEKILNVKARPAVVLIMSNGDFDGLHQKLIDRLRGAGH